MAESRYDFSPTDSQLCHFFSNWRGVIWDLDIEMTYADNTSCCYAATAFALNSSGLLMTAAHCLRITKDSDMGKPTIYGCRLEQNPEAYVVNVLECKLAWDVALLQVDGVDDCMFAKFADSGELSPGQVLASIGNPIKFNGSCSTGKVAFKCVDNPNIPAYDETVYWNHFVPRSLKITPHYRTMGDVYNKFYFRGLSKVEKKEIQYIHPHLPIVQMYDFGLYNGCSGSPIFNGIGDIVGMVFGFVEREGARYNIGIHVSVLKFFLEHYTQKGKNVAVQQIDDSMKPKMGPADLKGKGKVA